MRTTASCQCIGTSGMVLRSLNSIYESRSMHLAVRGLSSAIGGLKHLPSPPPPNINPARRVYGRGVPRTFVRPVPKFTRFPTTLLETGIRDCCIGRPTRPIAGAGYSSRGRCVTGAWDNLPRDAYVTPTNNGLNMLLEFKPPVYALTRLSCQRIWILTLRACVPSC